LGCSQARATIQEKEFRLSLGIAADFVLIVIAGFIGGLIARILRLPLLVGYVAAGVLVGPNTAGPTVVQIHDIELLAEIGIALLLFSLGMEISLRDLQPVKRIALFGGPIQIVLTAAAGALVGQRVMGLPTPEAVWLGAMVSLSSTMVVLKTLSEAGVSNTLASRVMLGLLVLQDLAVVPMMIILPQLSAPENLFPKLLRAIAIAALFLLAVVVLGTRLLPRLLRFVLTWGSRELFLVGVVAAGVGLGYAANGVGLSFALGAFVAGLVLSESEFSHQALSDLVPLRDIFGLIFFVTAGMLFDPGYVVAHPGAIAAGVLLILAGKAVIAGLIARAFGYRNMAPWIIGLGLSQIGEFSFLLARNGLSGGWISEDTYNLALSCTVLTMALSPVVSSAALPLGRVWRNWRGSEPVFTATAFPDEPLQGHVIVAGCGRTGRAVSRVLHAGSLPHVVVELDHAALSQFAAMGTPSVWGDVTHWEVLRAAGAETASVLVVTVPDRHVIELAVTRARQLNPRLTVISRAIREQDVLRLRQIGVGVTVQPEFEGGIEMVRQVLLQYHFEDSDAKRLVEKLRQELYGNPS
jgi:CPA2 family monovalent cation:H+ antiporter-2